METISKKHAICITAHKNWEQLKDLIETVSSNSTDIFLHVNKKSRDSFDKYFDNITLNINDNLYLINSKSVDWGGYSQLVVELDLFREVLKNKEKYTYVHLISGQDFPIKPIDRIIEECERTQFDYISFISEKNIGRYEKRLRYKHIMVENIRTSKFADLLRKAYLVIQMVMGVNLMKPFGLKFQVGANWVSLTIDSLLYIVEHFPKYEKLFSSGLSAEECYKQMILQTKVDARIMNNCRRFVIFPKNAPSPINLTMQLYDDIMNSDAFFARKFDDSVDKEIRVLIMNKIHKEQHER